MNKVWIIGTSSFSIDIGLRFNLIPGEGNIFMGFLDERPDHIQECSDEIKKYGLINQEVRSPESIDFNDRSNRIMFGISNPSFKYDFMQKYNIDQSQLHDFRIDTYFSEHSDVKPGIYFNTKTSNIISIGYGNFMDSNTIVGHDCHIGNYNHISLSVILCGSCKIGDRNIIHPGAIITRDVCIEDDCVIGAGCIITRDIKSGSTLVSPGPTKI